jgi:putative endonuclease
LTIFWPLWTFFDWLRQRQARASMTPEHALGRQGEDLAHRYLQGRGMRVIDRNWRSRRGLLEVDIIAQDGDRTVFIEVKTRRSAKFAAPERNIDVVKTKALVWAAREYCRKYVIDEQFTRIDYVQVVLEPKLKIEHEKDALSVRESTVIHA